MRPPLLKFFATPLPALVAREENSVVGFGPPHFRNAFAIAEMQAYEGVNLDIFDSMRTS